MAVKTINTELLQKMFLAGAANLEAKKEFINELNVFPVPDGDTGTNMTLTILSAAKEVKALENPDMVAIAKAISSGSLRGARGNSGVILSQLLRGFTKEIREHKEIDTITLAKACERATATAYKAVMKPKEGTILTVAKGASQKAAELAETTEDLDTFISEVINYAQEVLEKTPEMLPVLKEAGVVDSGGQGLIQVIKGCIEGLKGKVVDIDAAVTPSVSGNGAAKTATGAGSTQAADIRFGYCTEFIINAEKPADETTEQELKDYLSTIGASLVVVADDDIVKIHVHTNDPGLAIQKALTYGSLSRIKIDNMREEHQEKLIKDSERLAAQQKAEEEAKEKKEEYYHQKEIMLSALKPVCIHKECYGYERTRIYDYESDYIKYYDEFVWRNSFYDKVEDAYVCFGDIEDKSKPLYHYYLFYDVGYNRTFHTPIKESEVSLYDDLEVVEIDKLDTKGYDIADLLSNQFVTKVINLIESEDFRLVENI